ncbi:MULTISPECIES: sensor histidine kinase [unclassified Flavonifractor]|uniref:sensor histidine kinase n=1 Tax=unclassified Flavonifractor TaxID=2629267 RepID=UPI000B3A9A21|nr:MULTISPECIES: ATP-binding protein [unclassified Flavonifractor]OUN11264.1 PAS domain-containing sensor histidine kinase [Flavonifractor sp. An91]OUN84874.1 PAS domain-containing sensor histidine kinase [Flavonifractor sp. An52]
MKKRIIGATLLTVVFALLISNVVGVLMFRSREMDAARSTLQELLELMDAQSAITEPEALMEQFHAAAPDKRLTIIDTDGTVLADTDADASQLEDHNSRPEVIDAERSGWGEAARHSDTLGTSMFYVAKRFADGMIGRAAMPLSSINSLVMSGVWGFLIASIAALLLAFLLSHRTANRIITPLNSVGGALQGVLDGKKTPGLEDLQADDELRPILRYIDKLMDQLGGYIQSITAERDKVSLILDCMDEGLILLDEEGKVLAINRAARTLFGFPEGEQEDGALLLTRSRRLREAIHDCQEKHSSIMLDVDALTEDARSLRLFVSPVSGRQYEGQPVGTSILVSDVTELKKAEGIRSEFTANVSHELKTPLTSIKGFTDMLSSGMVTSPADQKRFITMIGVEVDRLIDLINDILKLSELESVAIDQTEERSAVLDAAHDTASLLEPSAKAAGVTLAVEGESVTVGVPMSRLKELLFNLMGNGIKYSENGGTVTTRVHVQDGKAVISVEDHGIGIPEEDQSRVFERFYRVEKGRARKNGGTGLGLAIVKHITQLYGGTVSLESQVGKGSTFTVILPIPNN